MQDELETINEMGLWDFEIARHENGCVLILGSNDFDYYHHLEAEFTGVTVCDLPATFSHALFRLGMDMGDGISTVWVNAVGPDTIDTQDFEIQATGLQLRLGTVYYYERENLKPGERIDNKRIPQG